MEGIGEKERERKGERERVSVCVRVCDVAVRMAFSSAGK